MSITKLVLIEENIINKRGNKVNKYQCECGKIVYHPHYRLKAEHPRFIRSCGCIRSIINKTHGLSKSRIYEMWCGMKKRCYNKKYRCYNHYGGKGITVCDEWNKDFMSFYNWAMANGYAENLSIDRIDNDKSYSPDNCRFVSQIIQLQNTSKTLSNEMVIKIKNLIKEKKQNKEIQMITGVANYVIKKIRAGKTYQNIN